jgi:hypothetical protein
LQDYLKCVYKENNNDFSVKTNVDNIIKVSFMEINGFPKKLYRIRCKIFELNEINLDSILIALVGENDEIPINYIEFQKPKVICGYF